MAERSWPCDLECPTLLRMGVWRRVGAIILLVGASCTAKSPAAHISQTATPSPATSPTIVPSQPTTRSVTPLPRSTAYDRFRGGIGTIKGVVRSRSGTPVSSICVSAYEVAGGDPWFDRAKFLVTRTDASG